MTETNPYDPSGSYLRALRIIYFVLSISGLIFSSTLLYIFIKKVRKSSHSDTVLSTIAVTIDVIASGGLLFKAIFTQYPYNIIKEHFNWCAYDLVINTHALALSGYVLSVVSLQRMLLIVFNLRFSIWIWLSIVVTLKFICLGQMIHQIIIDNISVSVVGVFCESKINLASQTSIIIAMVLMILTYSITIISYLFIIVFTCRQCLKQLDLNLDKSVVFREFRTIVFKSLFFLIPYMLIYSGFIFIFIYKSVTGNPITWLMTYVAILLLSTSVVVNCLTVLYMNKEINKEFINLICKVKLIFRQ